MVLSQIWLKCYNIFKGNDTAEINPIHQKYVNFITIDPSVLKIKDKSFCGLFSLTDIEIPSSVETFGNSCFQECKKRQL